MAGPVARGRALATLVAATAAMLLAATPACLRAAPPDYPTEAVADYVFGCMATNGQTQDALRRCACSIDAIAAAVPYEEYVRAETVLRMQQQPGDPRSTLFRQLPQTQAMVARLRQAQLDAEAKCF